MSAASEANGSLSAYPYKHIPLSIALDMTGLTKRELMAVTILIGLLPTTLTNNQVTNKAIQLADKLLENLEG